jgi:hypothetical protein
MRLPHLPHPCHTLSQWVWQLQIQRSRGLQSFCHTCHTSFSLKEMESRNKPHTLLAVIEESPTSIGMAGVSLAYKPRPYWFLGGSPHHQVSQKVWQKVCHYAGGNHALPA